MPSTISKHDIQRLLTTEQKREKWSRRLCDEVMSVQGEDRIQRVNELCLILEKHITDLILKGGQVTGSEEPANSAEAIAEELYASLARLMMDEGDIETFIEFQTRTLQKDEVEGLDDNLHVLVKARGRARFIRAFITRAGRDLQSSMQFALLLLRGFSESWGNVDVASLNKTDKIPTKPIGAYVSVFLAQTLSAPVKAGPEFKMWIEHIVKAASESEAASEVLESLLEVLAFMTNTSTLKTVNGEAPDSLERVLKNPIIKQFTEAYPMLMEGLIQMLAPKLELSPHAAGILKAWTERREEKKKGNTSEGERMLRWFAENLDEIQKNARLRSQDVLTNPKRGLRPHGWDHVDIQSVALRNAGIRSIIFDPDGEQFPDVAVRIVVRKETPHLMVFKTRLKDFNLELNSEVVRNKVHFEQLKELEQMLACVVTDIFHRIIVGTRKLKELAPKAAVSESKEGGQIPSIPVRPHLRKLPEGHKPSDKAKTRAAESLGGWGLPPGFTFVAAFYRGGEFAYDLPTSPTAEYTDLDLMDLRKKP